MEAHGRAAAAHDHADFKVGLADRRPAQALDLALRKPRSRRQRLHRTGGVDIAGDERAGIDAESVAVLEEDIVQLGHVRVERVEADRADLPEWQVHRNHDRCARHCPGLEVREVDRVEVVVGLARVKAVRIYPEGLAFEPAGRCQR